MPLTLASAVMLKLRVNFDFFKNIVLCI